MASDADARTGTRARRLSPPARGRPRAVPTAAPRARDAPRRATPLSRGPPATPRLSVCPSQLPDAHAKLPLPFSRAIPQVASILFVVGVVFIPLGVVCMMANKRVVEVSRRYDNDPACEAEFFATSEERATMRQTDGRGVQCSVNVMVPQTMKAPVFVYYELDNFYQNHRRYVKSRSDDQLRGEPVSGSTCAPELERVNATTGEKTTINPCGLMAWSYFNDTYAVAVDGESIAVNETDIAWRSDLKYKFTDATTNAHNDDVATRGGGAVAGSPSVDEHFVVWMRTAALSDFRKLWGRIETDIPAGATVTVDVMNRYNTYAFGGGKRVVLSTTSWLGGKNEFLGAAYLAVGVACVLGAGMFAYLAVYPPRKLGDVSELSWNK